MYPFYLYHIFTLNPQNLWNNYFILCDKVMDIKRFLKNEKMAFSFSSSNFLSKSQYYKAVDPINIMLLIKTVFCEIIPILL